jgi:hypothetical protein
MRDLVDALELWHESHQDCLDLALDRFVPRLADALDLLEQRLDRIGVLWQARMAPAHAGYTDDRLLLESLPLDADPSTRAALSHLQRAAFANYLAHLHAMDRASRELLRTMRALAGLESGRNLRVSPQQRDRFRPSNWDPARLLNALYPPAGFLSACIFWIVMNPPTGPKVPMFAGILALVVVRSAVSPVALVKVSLYSALFAVAPIYWLVMPAMSTGFELLSLIFFYSFVFGFLGGRSPLFKMGPMLMFVAMTGISNQQKYSFTGLVDGMLMILLAGVILAVIYVLFTPLQPEQSLLRSLRRFFRGCARFTESLAWDHATNRPRGRRIGKRYLESMVLPGPGKIEAVQPHLDYQLHPDNSPERVRLLCNGVQGIAYRLQALEIARDRIVDRATDVPEPFATFVDKARKMLQHVFEHWENLEPGDAFEPLRSSLQRSFHDLQQQLDSLTTDHDPASVGDGVLADLYTMLGSVRGLIDAMANTQTVINQINWRQWAVARF